MMLAGSQKRHKLSDDSKPSAAFRVMRRAGLRSLGWCRNGYMELRTVIARGMVGARAIGRMNGRQRVL
jgi:hypothetical protein